MRTVLCGLAVSAFTLTPSIAGAQFAPTPPGVRSTSTELAPIAVSPPTPPTATPDPWREELRTARGQPRIRFGIGGHGGFGVVGRAAGGGLGAAIDLGVQLGDPIAIYAAVRASTLLFLNYVSAGVMVEWTPVDVFSLGTGVTAAGAAAVGIFGSGTAGTDLAIPLSIAFNIGGRPAMQAHRSAFRIALEGSISVGLGTNPGGYGALTLAWARM